jgi:hypothetical protein
MPLVSATDVPLQPFPTGRTSPQAPDVYERIPTSPTMFGSIQAEALQQAGQQGEKLATEVAKIGAYQQHKQDLAEIDQLRTRHDDAVHKAKYGDPEAGIDLATGKPLVPGFANMHGQEAVDYIRSGAPSKNFNDDLQRIAASASSDRVRQLFLHQARATRAAFDNSIGEHWNRELGAQQAAALKAGDISTSRDALAEWNDDAALAVAINKKIDYYTRGQTDPLVRDAMYYKAVGEGVEHAVNGAMMAGNLPRAMQLLEAYKPHMDADQAQKVWKSIEPEYNKAVVRAMQPGAVGAGFRAPPGPPISGATSDEQRVLNEVRFRESTNRYDLIHPPTKTGEVPGGAYGFLPGTWNEATSATGIGTEYPTADKAPAAVQDANALWLYRKYGTKPWAASGPYDEGAVVQGQGGAIRNLPIAKTVNAQLERAATTVGELKVEVFSGGQPSSGPNRTGSHRHDEGGAADIQLRDTKTRRLLDMRNPADRARMQAFITEAVAAGATGVGAAEDYMGPHGIHIGGGTPAAWGRGGSSANAPDWVKGAFEAGRARQSRPPPPRAPGMIEPPNIAPPSG